MKDEERDEIDKILDDALSGYTPVEPRLGFESRVLRHVTAAAAVPRASWLHIAVPVAALVLLLVIAGPLWLTRKHVATPKPVTASINSAPAKPVAVADEHIHSAIKAIRRRDHVRLALRTLPKQNQFPSPAPLSKEERDLLLLASTSREKSAPALVSESSAVEPLQIPPVEIEPLRSSDMN